MPELWQPVPGYENYSVSNYGRVWTHNRNRLMKNGTTNGRPIFQFSKDGQKGFYKLHQLVALVFIGPNPDGLYVCHRDDDKLNNHVDNLYYGTVWDNAKDAIANQRLKRGEDSHKAKVTEKQVIEMRWLSSSGMSYAEIARRFGLGRRAVRLACLRLSWKHVA